MSSGPIRALHREDEPPIAHLTEGAACERDDNHVRRLENDPIDTVILLRRRVDLGKVDNLSVCRTANLSVDRRAPPDAPCAASVASVFTQARCRRPVGRRAGPLDTRRSGHRALAARSRPAASTKDRPIRAFTPPTSGRVASRAAKAGPSRSAGTITPVAPLPRRKPRGLRSSQAAHSHISAPDPPGGCQRRRLSRIPWRRRAAVRHRPSTAVRGHRYPQVPAAKFTSLWYKIFDASRSEGVGLPHSGSLSSGNFRRGSGRTRATESPTRALAAKTSEPYRIALFRKSSVGH